MPHKRGTGVYHICKQCGNEFEGKYDSSNQYCKRACYDKSRIKHKEPINCDVCGDELSLDKKRKHYFLKRKKGYSGKYCGQECFNESLKNGKYKNCENCGDRFWVKQSNIERGWDKYCCNVCKHEHINLYPNTIELRNRINSRNRIRVYRSELDEKYLRGYIKDYYGLNEVPSELIELKRLNITRKRKLKEITHGNSQ